MTTFRSTVSSSRAATIISFLCIANLIFAWSLDMSWLKNHFVRVSCWKSICTLDSFTTPFCHNFFKPMHKAILRMFIVFG